MKNYERIHIATKFQNFNIFLVFLFLLINVFMLYFAWQQNPGSNLHLILFSFSAFLISCSALMARTFTAWCVGTFLWLGLWLKFVVHLYNPSVLVEPVGDFAGTAYQYDLVMIASTLALLAASISFFLGRFLGINTVSDRIIPSRIRAKFLKSQIFPYFLLVFICLIVAATNSRLGIFQVGIAPLTILPRPGNALISLFLTTGYFISISYVILCDVSNRKSLAPGVVTLIFCAAIMSTSLLSRGVVVFHLAAVLLAVAAYTWHQRTWNSLVLLIGAVILSAFSFFLTIGFVQDGRDINFGAPKVEQVEDGMSRTFRVISQLAVGRWVGVEGAMVAVANQNNSQSLMMQMLGERSQIGKNAMYQYLAKSHYVDINGERFQFATLPGPVGAFLFGGSVLYVFFGMLILCLLAMALEKLSQLLTRSPFVTSFVAVFAANSVAQFGLTPISQLPQLLYMLILLVGFWGIRTIAPRLTNTPFRHVLPAATTRQRPLADRLE